MNVSVVIATCNRADHLRRALTSLQGATVPPGAACETIVVDNNSTDETRALAARLSTTCPGTFRYLAEPRQGKSLALNTGVKAAAGDVIAFTDDDCIVDPTWIEAMLNAFRSDESLDGVGGRVELYNSSDRPVSVRTSRQPFVFSSATQLFSSIIGCNMAFRRRVFDVVGAFDPQFGPGSKVGTVEDIDFLYRVHRAGCRVIYSPDVLVYHNHGRRTDNEVERIRHLYVSAHGAFYAKYILKADPIIVNMACQELLSVARNFHGRPLLWLLQGLACGFYDRLRTSLCINRASIACPYT